jgi:hypothetical protein
MLNQRQRLLNRKCERAYYEFLCKRAEIQVHYCADPFACDDPSMMAALLKAIKRVMAGEYLRELSAKVIATKDWASSLWLAN